MQVTVYSLYYLGKIYLFVKKNSIHFYKISIAHFSTDVNKSLFIYRAVVDIFLLRCYNLIKYGSEVLSWIMFGKTENVLF